MKFCKLLTVVAITFFATSCTTITQKEPTRENYLSGTQRDFTLLAKGKTVFQCTYDNEGFYWKYEQIEGKLYSYSHKQKGSFTANGLRLGSKDEWILTPLISTTRPNGDLGDTLFSISSQQNTKHPKFVERVNARGGMPLTKCSPSQRYTLLKVPFEARYVFYK